MQIRKVHGAQPTCFELRGEDEVSSQLLQPYKPTCMCKQVQFCKLSKFGKLGHVPVSVLNLTLVAYYLDLD